MRTEMNESPCLIGDYSPAAAGHCFPRSLAQPLRSPSPFSSLSFAPLPWKARYPTTLPLTPTDHGCYLCCGARHALWTPPVAIPASLPPYLSPSLALPHPILPNLPPTPYTHRSWVLFELWCKAQAHPVDPPGAHVAVLGYGITWTPVMQVCTCGHLQERKKELSS